jgi:hypothetical protein
VPALRGADLRLGRTSDSGGPQTRADLVPRSTKVPNADTDATTRRLTTAMDMAPPGAHRRLPACPSRQCPRKTEVA